jgi:hypothetical protein
MSAIELRMMTAAQIMAAMSANFSPNTPDSTIRERAELAAKVARELEDAVSRSLST